MAVTLFEKTARGRSAGNLRRSSAKGGGEKSLVVQLTWLECQGIGSTFQEINEGLFAKVSVGDIFQCRTEFVEDNSRADGEPQLRSCRRRSSDGVKLVFSRKANSRSVMVTPFMSTTSSTPQMSLG